MKVTIYSITPCPYCVRAKNFFTDQGQPFEDLNLTGKWDDIEALKNKTGHKTFPQIFVNDEFIGGYDDMMKRVNAKQAPFNT